MTALGRARLISFLVPFALMAGALGSQYLGGLYPCEMCQWQRWWHYGAIALALLAFANNTISVRTTLVLCAALCIFGSGATGAYHAGVEYKWWAGPPECTRLPGEGGDLLHDIMTAPMIRCDEPQWSLFGISLAGFNAIISVAASFVIFTFLGKDRS